MFYGSADENGYFLSPVKGYDEHDKSNSGMRAYILALKGMIMLDNIDPHTLTVKYNNVSNNSDDDEDKQASKAAKNCTLYYKQLQNVI